MSVLVYNPRLHRFPHLVRVSVPTANDIHTTHGVEDHPQLHAWLLANVGTYGEDWDWEWDNMESVPFTQWCFALNVRDPQKAMLLKLAWGDC
jgi:hypothetical protein